MKHLSFSLRISIPPILNVFLVTIFCILASWPIAAQITYPRTVSFETHDQSLWGAGPAFIAG
ncbi:MAG: hypothetical protein ACKVT2_20695, partial [Saprospiraceae bacterium]